MEPRGGPRAAQEASGGNFGDEKVSPTSLSRLSGAFGEHFGSKMEPKPTFRRDLFDHPVREVLRDQKMKKIEHVWSPGKVAFEDVVVSCSVLVSKRDRLDQL